MSPVPYPVVFICCDEVRLYSELIQTIVERNSCWLRPLSLQVGGAETGDVAIVDLRNGPDIICSHDLVQPALDTDWLDLLAAMNTAQVTCNYAQANQHLRCFLERLLAQIT